MKTKKSTKKVTKKTAKPRRTVKKVASLLPYNFGNRKEAVCRKLDEVKRMIAKL